MRRFRWRNDSSDPGFYADQLDRYEARWIGEDGRKTGFVYDTEWDPGFGAHPESQFWMSGSGGAFGMVEGVLLVVTHEVPHRRASRLRLPVEACTLRLHHRPERSEVCLRIRVDLGRGEAPTDAWAEITLPFTELQGDELADLIVRHRLGPAPERPRRPVPAGSMPEREARREPAPVASDPDSDSAPVSASFELHADPVPRDAVTPVADVQDTTPNPWSYDAPLAVEPPGREPVRDSHDVAAVFVPLDAAEVASAEVASAVSPGDPVPGPVTAAPGRGNLARLAVVSAPDDDDWICLRPMPSDQRIITRVPWAPPRGGR